MADLDNSKVTESQT